MKENVKRNWKKRKLFFGGLFCLFAVLFSGITGWTETAEPFRTPEELKQLYARSAVLMDGDSGRVLFGKNEQEELPMASTTKILTCILALELGEPQQICTVTSNAAAQPKVHLGMQEGETYYLNDLLYSLMLESHNDTAVCIAETLGGSTEHFAELMNQKAKEIGCEHAHFVTPNGLDGEDAGGIHRISAADLALVMRYCITQSEKKEEFLEITGTAQYLVQEISGKRSISCSNHNALLTMMEGVLSGKTGFTGNAGYCYVGAVRREDKTLIVALLACGWPNNRSYKWTDSRKLLEYGFSNYQKKTLELSGLSIPEIPVLRGQTDTVCAEIKSSREGKGQKEENGRENRMEKQTVSVLVREDEELQARIETVSALQAPVREGQTVGRVWVFAGSELLEEHLLVSKNGSEAISYRFCLGKVWEMFTGNLCTQQSEQGHRELLQNGKRA